MATSWYVLRSKPNKEEFFWGQLLAHQIEVYYACILAKVFSPHAHKIKPYFPCLLFIHIDLQEITPSFLHWLPGSRGLVVFDEQPAPVPDNLIAAIRHRVGQINGTNGEWIPSLQTGEIPDLKDCSLNKYETIFDGCLSGNERVHVLLKILRGEQLPVELIGV